MKRIIGRCIWNFHEFLGISLGKFAPIVFGWMIGATKCRKLSEQEIREDCIPYKGDNDE